MKKIFILLSVPVLLAAVFFLVKNIPGKNNPPAPISENNADVSETQNSPVEQGATSPPPSDQDSGSFRPPLDRAAERVTKKPFGIFITPQTSPVQPDKFQGYHTGTDFEIFPGEENSAVPVRAICDGKLVLKKTASGYGGVAVQNCEIDGKTVIVVYGHLKLSSISKKIGENMRSGEKIGVLGKGYSSETDGARKHLHLSIHESSALNILGYVAAASQLSGWLDPCLFVCK